MFMRNQKILIMLIGAESGIGKTAFADELFVHRAYDFIKSRHNPGIKLKIIYYSFEIDKYIKLTKAMCRKLYLDYGILTDVNYMLSRGRNRASEEIYEKVLETRKYFEGLEDILDIYDAGMNPTGIKNQLWEYCDSVGKREVINNKTSYKLHDDNLYTFVIFDHASLVRREQGFDVKQTIDKLSQYLVPLRNICQISPVVVQQLGRQLASTDRFKLEMVTPQPNDFKGTGNTFEDCNICLALFSPYRYEMPSFRKYDIATLKDRFRSLSILKNRDGESDKVLGMNFIGEVGYFRELPKGEEMSPEDYQRAVDHKKIQSEPNSFLNLMFDDGKAK